MRRVVFHLSTNLCGPDVTEFAVYPLDVSEEELNQDAWEMAVQHAESYGAYCDVGNDYNINGYWEDFDPEKHGDGRSTIELFERLTKEYNNE